MLRSRELAASESLGAVSKFAHQPVSFQRELKLTGISRFGPLAGGAEEPEREEPRSSQGPNLLLVHDWLQGIRGNA